MKRAILSLVALWAVIGTLGMVWADDTGPQPVLDSPVGEPVAANVAGLLDTLTKGLQARRASEFTFLKKVVTYVKVNKITKKMVLETFHWARKKSGLRRDGWRRYPYPYFERAIKIRAARIGVKL